MSGEAVMDGSVFVSYIVRDRIGGELSASVGIHVNRLTQRPVGRPTPLE